MGKGSPILGRIYRMMGRLAFDTFGSKDPTERNPVGEITKDLVEEFTRNLSLYPSSIYITSEDHKILMQETTAIDGIQRKETVKDIRNLSRLIEFIEKKSLLFVHCQSFSEEKRNLYKVYLNQGLDDSNKENKIIAQVTVLSKNVVSENETSFSFPKNFPEDYEVSEFTLFILTLRTLLDDYIMEEVHQNNSPIPQKILLYCDDRGLKFKQINE